MSNNSSSLYGISRPKATASKKDLTSSSNLAFTTHLSSLISKDTNRTSSSASDSSTIRARSRPSKSKSDIFGVHNKNVNKRAAADLSDNGLTQVHQRASDIGEADEAALHRSKRKMTEKAKLYAELKSGSHLIDSDDEDESARNPYAAAHRGESNSLVDFDRKWAEEEERKAHQRRENGEKSDSNASDHEEDEDEDDTSSLVDYEDEFGRSRRGTKSEAARASRLKKSQSDAQTTSANADDSSQRARPSRPSNLIHGNTIQSSAFNASSIPEMTNLAQRRDRTPTPPPETHYDADAEVRSRGTGFYAFSKDEEVRKKEMEELTGVRKETEKERERLEGRKRERERKKEERRKEIERVRSKRRAEVFLKELGEGLGENEEGGQEAAKE